MVPPLLKGEEDKKNKKKTTNEHIYNCLNYVIFIGKMYTYKITYKSTGDYMYFKMADVSLHLSLQHYTILPPLRKGEEDTVLRLEGGHFVTIFDDFFEFFIFRSRSRHIFNSFSKLLIARIHVHDDAML